MLLKAPPIPPLSLIFAGINILIDIFYLLKILLAIIS